MRKHRICLLALALFTLCGGLFAAPQELEERDHKALGKLFAEYLDPKADSGDLEDVREGLVKALEKIGKKLVGKDGDQLQAALALTTDLGRGASFAIKYKNARGGKPISGEIDSPLGEITYTVWVPKSYRASNGPYPVVIVMPGMYEGKPMSSSHFLVEHWNDADVRDSTLIAVIDMPEDVEAWNLTKSADGGPGGVMAAMLTFRDLRDTYAMDSDRVFLLGMENGVPAAMSLGSKFPHLFAGVIGQAGDAGEVGFANFRNLPVLLQGAGLQAETFKEGADAAEHGNCELRPAATTAEMWAWAEAHPRVSNPNKVTLALGAPIPNKAYWIEVPSTDGVGLTIHAEADREANKITVTGTGVPSVTLFLNDELVDLSRPLTIVLNGVEQTTMIPRSLDDMLSLLKRGTSDPGKFYVAAKTFDLPQ